MTMNVNVVRGVCHLLGLDPNTTTRIDIDAAERTVNISSVNITNGFSLQHEEHRIAPSTTTKPSWELTKYGYIEPRNSDNTQDWEKARKQLRDESPIFAAAADTHNLTVDLQNNINRTWAKL